MAGFALRSARLAPLAGLALGACLTLAASEALLARWVSAADEGRTLLVRGQVEGLARTSGPITRFRFLPLPGEAIEGRLTVAWHDAPAGIGPGQRWRLPLRVNRPGGSLNFGLFDYEKWLFAKGLVGRAYVAGEARQEAAGGWAVFDRLRDRLRQQVRRQLGETQTAGIVAALMLGDTSGIGPEAWRVFSFTGVIHLLIISGLHVGIIALLVWQLGRWLGLGLLPGALATGLAAWLYAQLAGWGLPVQRALVMVVTVLLARALARRLPPMQHFGYAAAFVLALQPLSLLSQGAWLSFGAVALLLAFVRDGYGGTRRPWALQVRRALRAQWVIYVGMAPLLVGLVGYLAGGALLVNLFAIPLVGFLLVPGVLATALLLLASEALAAPMLALLAGAVDGVLWLLEGAAALSPVVYPQPGEAWAALRYGLAACGCLLLLLPKGLAPRWLGLVCCCCLAPGGKPNEGLAITFYDVGQGLSVAVEAEGSLLVYDTGPAYGDGYSAARQTLLPSLRARGHRVIDRLVISHWDNDHAGGLVHLQEEMVIGALLGSEADAKAEVGACAGAWRRGEARFRLFSAPGLSGNDSSCLLHLAYRQHSLLLTGDIEAPAEYRLLADLPMDVTVMSAPHHGSKTSSSPALVNRTRPEIVVASTGYRNRFDHPAAHVRQRYVNRGAWFLDTAEAGAIRITLREGRMTVERARDRLPALWRRP